MNRNFAVLPSHARGVHAASAQPGFVEGDVYLVSPALADGPGSMRGIMHIDPTTWAGTVLPYAPTPGLIGRSAAYDASRDRLVFIDAGIQLMAADGTATLLPVDFIGPRHPTPTGDGRIYFLDNTNTFRYVDAAGVSHTLLDQGGVNPYVYANISVMTWDRGANALFFTDSASHPFDLTLTRVTLTPDGTRVQGVDAVVIDTSSSGETGVGINPGPGGSLFVAIDTNSNAAEPRLQLVDPTTLAVTTYATPGYLFVAGEIAGAYLPLLSTAVVLDSANDVLRLFTQGQAGEGTTLPTVGVSNEGGSGEIAQLVVISRACSGGADLAPPFGTLDFSDILAYLTAFGAMDPAADLAPPSGVFDFSDVLAFLTAFGAGCP
ncbi:MAG: GC-type dockerin domain-anchored protein [Phycisphaerales bacterium]